ncbi:MFS transporter [Nonomuraea sp. NPDC049269]|uniref:MFS transporter n=1 Tax=Nonomuraea sp. NPDC049269 TaxID=3364349 RepID=UPI003720444C
MLPLRLARSALFAAVCVTLAALAHWFAGGTLPSPARLALGAAVVTAITAVAAGREREPVLIALLLGAAQLLLHGLFTWHAAPTAMPPGHGLASDVEMELCHLTATLMTGWWVARGETALWSVLRRLAVRVVLLLAPCPIRPPAPSAPAYRAPGIPYESVVLRHAVVRRGPPLPAAL